jgi:3-methyl-2-oxobutanoate hydroxymethyltransferase
VLVSYDMLGLFDGGIPAFVKQYAHLADDVRAAARAYVDDVRSGRYPLTAASRHVTTG